MIPISIHTKCLYEPSKTSIYNKKRELKKCLMNFVAHNEHRKKVISEVKKAHEERNTSSEN